MDDLTDALGNLEGSRKRDTDDDHPGNTDDLSDLIQTTTAEGRLSDLSPLFANTCIGVNVYAMLWQNYLQWV